MVDDPDLFQYTSGRWVYNESIRLAERKLVFDIGQLGRLAAESTNRAEEDVASLRKIAEGGFNRVFQITMRDGHEVIARLPFPTTIPKSYAVASEVATMDYLRAHDVPTPRVLDYSTTRENPVGAEYIIMEKVPGRDLGDLWYAMSEPQRLKVIRQVVLIEALLFSIRLPAIGSIYYKHDLAPTTRSVGIEPASGRTTFCVGPDAHYKWWYKERSKLSFDQGPFSSAAEVLEAVGKRELLWTERHARPRFPFEPLYRDIYDYEKVNPAAHVKNLSDYLLIAKSLAPQPASVLNQPTIRHPDLQPSNIFVSDTFDVVGIIDWQHCSILPLFLQAGPPKYFQNYGDEESEKLVKPQLSKDFASLSNEEREAAEDLFRQRQFHYYYFANSAKFNKDHFDACMDDKIIPRQKLFQHAGNPWEGDNITLRADLIRAAQNWVHLTDSDGERSTECPLVFSPQDTEECLKLEAEHREADEYMEKSRACLGVTEDGWVPTERYDDAKSMSERLKAEAMDVAESDEARAQIQRHWPFDDRDEDE